MTHYRKEFELNAIAAAEGDGYWGLQADVEVELGTLTLNFNTDGYLNASVSHNLKASEGLPYSDSGVFDALRDIISEHEELSSIITDIYGSEQGAQDDYVLDCDVSIADLTEEQLATFEIIE